MDLKSKQITTLINSFNIQVKVRRNLEGYTKGKLFHEEIDANIVYSGTFYEQIALHCEKDLFNFNHKRIIALMDTYERTMEEVYYLLIERLFTVGEI